MNTKYNQGVAESNRRRAKHGQARDGKRTKLYDTWLGIKDRCLNPKSAVYHRYGGRGIAVCREWVDSFEAFYKHVGEAPTPKHTLDRIDNDKGYEPENVRWATRKEQSNNISSNTWVEYGGMRMTWAQWAEYLEVPYNLLMSRVKKQLPLNKILQPRVNRKRGDPVEFNGKAMSLREWAVHTGVPYQTIYYRWRLGKPLF